MISGADLGRSVAALGLLVCIAGAPVAVAQLPEDVEEQRLEDLLDSLQAVDPQREAVPRRTIPATEVLALSVTECWRRPEGPAPTVWVVAQLARDGSIIGAPRVEVFPVPEHPTAAQDAFAAVVGCAPYDFLPEAGYQSWRTVTFAFEAGGVQVTLGSR